MPRSTGWRTDPNLYSTRTGPIHTGSTEVDASSEAGARSGTAVADLTGTSLVGPGPGTGASRSVSASVRTFIYAQGFIVYDFNALINPVDLSVTYELVFPDDPDLLRDDWLGNVTGNWDDGIVWEVPHGTLATDAPIAIDTLIYDAEASASLVDLHFWQVDEAVVYHDGTGWHASSIPLNNVLSAEAASPFHLDATGIELFPVALPGELFWVFDLNSHPFSFADLRVDNNLAFAVSLDPSTDAFSMDDISIGYGPNGPPGFGVQYRNPRYRLLFKDSPLRQHPRDDALGGTPRQGRDSRSVQASTRQGWAGAYR